MSALSAIHIKRKQLGIHEDDWRDVVERMTGQRSTKNLTPKQSYALLAELDRLMGGRNISPSKPSRKPIEGPYAKKIQALWIAGWNVGEIKDRSDEALNKWATGQAKVDHANWIRSHEDAVAVVEALKKMLERHGVDWRAPTKGDPKFLGLPGYKIAVAQWKMVEARPEMVSNFAAYVRSLTEKAPDELSPDEWIIVMNALGRIIRAQKKADA